jgi:hypothetical protein
LLPTLNGWLLGYPVVYLVSTPADAELAARCLSSSVLQLAQFWLDADPSGWFARAAGAAMAAWTPRQLLLAFSWPVGLSSIDKAWCMKLVICSDKPHSI